MKMKMKIFKEKLLHNIVSIIGLVFLLVLSGTFLGTYVSEALASVTTGTVTTDTDGSDGSKTARPNVNINGTAHKATAVVSYKQKMEHAYSTYTASEDARYILVDRDNSKSFWTHTGSTTSHIVIHDLAIHVCGLDNGDSGLAAEVIRYQFGIGVITENDATDGTVKFMQSDYFAFQDETCITYNWGANHAAISGELDGETPAFFAFLSEGTTLWDNDDTKPANLTGGTVLPDVGDIVIVIDELVDIGIITWSVDASYTSEEPI